MSERLKKIFADNDWKADPNKPQVRASYYRALLKTQLGFPEQITVRQELANELLRAGDSDAAIHELEGLRAYIQQNPGKSFGGKGPAASRGTGDFIFAARGTGKLSSLSWAEIVPVPTSGFGSAQVTRGAQGAVRELSALLEQHPDDLESRWLLNVAYMQLGKYPHDVPLKWLVPSQLFDSDYDIGEFWRWRPLPEWT